ncbi:hypothetical protein EON64_01685, partial [archaeon]
MDSDLENWHVKQGAILTGEGALLKESEVYTDYLPCDLAHYHLVNRTSHTVFRAWIKANRRSFSVVGCWSRPLFAGGFLESTSSDTEAFNLQTPSLFIDMRIPTKRPTTSLARLSGLDDCSEHQLRVLARQHCFAGYTLPELTGPPHINSTSSIPTHAADATTCMNPGQRGELFTRHHVVDWNFHPRFPRPRPNRWWVLRNRNNSSNSKSTEDEAPQCSSFKEFSWVRDQWQLPLYMERWERRGPLAHQTSRYLACRRSTEGGHREALFLIVGAHFCFVRDRDYTLLP